MSDRVVGALLFVLAVAYGVVGRNYESAFTSDPLGPSAFPQLLAVALGITALVLLFRPGPGVEWPHGLALVRQIVAVAVLLAYAFVLEPVGFIPATAAAIAVLAVQLGGRWGPAAVLGLGVSIGLFILFDPVLGLPLPAGALFGG